MRIRETTGKRIEWIDIFKGLLMIMVVVGHTTGRFNMFIYQFHVGAFFLISGMVAKNIEGDPLKCIVKKGYGLLLPIVVVFATFLFIMRLFFKIGVYHIFFQQEYYGIPFFCRQLVHGNIYIEWLGAAWFIIVLFGIMLLRETIGVVFKDKNVYINLCISFFIACIGIFMQMSEKGSMSFRLVLITQFIYMCGKSIKEKNITEYLDNGKICLLVLIINIALFIFFRKNNYIMDIATGTWPNPLIAWVMILNGASFLCIFCKMLERYTKCLKSVFIYIGKNTFGILLFHFMGFKVAYLVLYMLNVIPKEDIALLCPKAEVGNLYWWLIAGISIGVCLLIWQIIKNFKITRIIMGQDKRVEVLLGQKIKISDCNIRKLLYYIWVIVTIIYFVYQINPRDIYSAYIFEKNKQYNVEEIYGDKFLGETATIEYTSKQDAIMNIELFQTDEIEKNILKVYIEGKCINQYNLSCGSNMIQIEVPAAEKQKIDIVFDKYFIPDEVSGSGDERKLTCQLIDIQLERKR